MDSGSKSNSATPITAPAEKPRIRCSRSRKRSANTPPSRVATKASAAMRTTIPETPAARLFLPWRLQPRIRLHQPAGPQSNYGIRDCARDVARFFHDVLILVERFVAGRVGLEVAEETIPLRTRSP